MGKANKAPDTICQCPFNKDLSSESDVDSYEVKVISYLSVCEVVNLYLESTKIHNILALNYNQ